MKQALLITALFLVPAVSSAQSDVKLIEEATAALPEYLQEGATVSVWESDWASEDDPGVVEGRW